MTSRRSAIMVSATTAAVVLAFATLAAAQSTNTSTNTSSNTSTNTSSNTSSRASPRAVVVNGGITQDEAEQIARQADAYPLELRFSHRMATGDAFAAGVDVRIVDATGGTVMRVPAADPILLADLPPGRYTVDATYQGRTQRQHVTLGRGHQKLGFTW